MSQDKFLQWFDALEKRHLADLNFAEVRRAVQALSSLYVERRGRLESSSPFSGAGKRAAFSLFFGPLHFLLVREIVRALDAHIPEGATLVDLGCGTGVAAAAWALEMEPPPKLIGLDRNSWVLQECRWTYQQLGLRGDIRSVDVGHVRIPGEAAVIAAFTINELDPEPRNRFHDEFLKRAGSGVPVLIVEPIARRTTSWWDEWARDFAGAGGRADEWRFRVALPERLALMDRAAGLDHRELKGRSLWLPGSA